MATYIILSTLSPLAFDEPGVFQDIAKKVAEEVKRKCPNTRWKAGYATMGRFDSVDLIESDDPGEVTRAVMIIRSYGRSTTETLLAVPWEEFLSGIR